MLPGLVADCCFAREVSGDPMRGPMEYRRGTLISQRGEWRPYEGADGVSKGYPN